MRKLSITLKLTYKGRGENIPDIYRHPIDIIVYDDVPNLHLPAHHAEHVAKEFNKFIDYPGRTFLKPIALLLDKEFELPMPHTGYLITAEDINYTVLKAIEEEQLEEQAAPFKKLVHSDDCWKIKLVETIPANIKTDLERIKIPKTSTIHSTNVVPMEDGRIYVIITHKD
jgi:hypothetical protein